MNILVPEKGTKMFSKELQFISVNFYMKSNYTLNVQSFNLQEATMMMAWWCGVQVYHKVNK